MSEVDAALEHDAMTELAREILQESEEGAHSYLVQSWLSSAIEKLHDVRRQAGLTQEEVAQRLGTKQPAIARLERDDEGRVSLHRYVAFALACGYLPLDMSLRPASALREYALDDPDAPRTETAFETWNKVASVSRAFAPANYFDTDLVAWIFATNSPSEFGVPVEEPEDEIFRTAATFSRMLKETCDKRIRGAHLSEVDRTENTTTTAARAPTTSAA